MAWVTQFFGFNNLKATLYERQVVIEDRDSLISLVPIDRDEARCLALVLRRSAKRLEEIAKILPEKEGRKLLESK